jgi:antirestriction protein ArdC
MSQDVFATITNNIVATLETGVAPWIQPWSTHRLGASMPLNATTGRPYHGVNALYLWCVALRHGYSSNGWMTFNQAKNLGGHVRKGEKGTQIIFWRPMEKEVVRNGALKKERTMILRTFTVFNVSQVDGIDPSDLRSEADGNVHNDPHASLVAAAERMGIQVETGRKFCYRPATDSIVLVPSSECVSSDHHTAAFAHELAHATGHKSRLDRDLSGRFGDDSYAAEELVAELASAFICAELHVDGALQHASYLDHWIKVLRANPRAIITVSSAATKAAALVLGTNANRESDAAETSAADAQTDSAIAV